MAATAARGAAAATKQGKKMRLPNGCAKLNMFNVSHQRPRSVRRAFGTVRGTRLFSSVSLIPIARQLRCEN